MKINAVGINLIKSKVPLKLKANLCSANSYSIGYGTTTYPNKVKVREHEFCTPEIADSWLRYELAKVESYIERKVKVELNENQFSALVVLAHDIGTSSFSKSSLLKKLNAADIEEASAQFLSLGKTKGEDSRVKERALFDNQACT